MFQCIGDVSGNMNKHQKIIDNLCRIAEAVEPINSARLAAAIVYKNRIVAYGTNKRKSHTFQSKYGKNEHAIYLHAENDAIKNALRYIHIDDLSYCTLYVARVKRIRPRSMYIQGLAKPCRGCMGAINTFKLKGIIHTLDEEAHTCLRNYY